jgi:oxygen-independent coproporphyrinogen-3 oxidase
MNKKIGIYIHVPFCISKCAYCDFYSLSYSEELVEKYVEKIASELNRWGTKLKCSADTLYFGGGTPSLLSSGQISRIIEKAKENFGLEDAEITVEVNPKEDLADWFKCIKKCGVNRVSLGYQSGIDSELELLSRRHKVEDVIKAVEDIRAAGIDNFSLDLMIGIPNQDKQSLKRSIETALSLNPSHISAYLLSIEKNTPFYKMQNKLNIPDDDKAAELYLATCDLLKEKGFERYEISNFAKDKKYSKHNTKYWKSEQYLGLGPGAHSFLSGKRFYYGRSLVEYIESPLEIFEDGAGGFEEWFMLSIRLREGVAFKQIAEKFKNIDVSQAIIKADLFVKGGLLEKVDSVYRLTDKGAVISNAVITQLLMAFKEKP